MRNRTFTDIRLDKPDQARQRCIHWFFGGRCISRETPPDKSRCIGSFLCDEWEYKHPFNRGQQKVNQCDCGGTHEVYT